MIDALRFITVLIVSLTCYTNRKSDRCYTAKFCWLWTRLWDSCVCVDFLTVYFLLCNFVLKCTRFIFLYVLVFILVHHYYCYYYFCAYTLVFYVYFTYISCFFLHSTILNLISSFYNLELSCILCLSWFLSNRNPPAYFTLFAFCL